MLIQVLVLFAYLDESYATVQKTYKVLKTGPFWKDLLKEIEHYLLLSKS